MLRRMRQSLRQVLFLMARRPDLLCGAIVFSVLLVLAVKFTCSRAKNVVAPARPPVRFFSSEAPIVDLYYGQLDQVERLRSVADVSFIFFYAPWCAHSMAARQEVQQVAKKLAKQVQFVAINCWYSQGKCRRQFRFYHYPIIHLFYRKFGPIEYKGPFVAPYVESFLRRVITPLTYLPSRATLEEFLSYHEPRVVGFFQFNSSPQPPGYITYLSSALQALKRDFHGVVRFGVVTNKQVAEAISLREDQSVYLHRRFNSSLIFPRLERNFTSEAICSWVFEHRETFLQWLQPPGTKSRILEQELNKGPALLLFLPHDPLRSSPTLHQIADVAVRYHSCAGENHSVLDRGLTPPPLCCQSLLMPESSARVCELCLSASGRSRSSSPVLCSFPSAAQGGHGLQSHLRNLFVHQLPVPASRETSAASAGCSNFLTSYSPITQYSACCRTIQPQLNDSQAKEDRDTHKLSLTSPPSSAPQSSVTRQGGDGITGLRCQTNRTLRFYLLDVALNWPLAVRLGATGNRTALLDQEDPGAQEDPEAQEAGSPGDGGGHRSFAAIVNLKDEVHYVLHRNPTATLTESLEAFIRNFSAPYSLLERHLVGVKKNRVGSEEEHGPQTPRPLIAELTTSSFLPSIMDLKKDVLVYYYTQWCGFCSVLNHIIVQLARLLQGNGIITVARVNVARNDLPWEFMVDRVPSILLFPRYRKHFSVKFPEDELITLPNLLHFILKHSGPAPDANKPAAPPPLPEVDAPGALVRAEVRSLQHEVQMLHQARERLSQQLAQLWRDNRRLTFDARGLEAQNAELQRERRSLEEQHQEKSRQLGEAVRRLRELAHASESLLNENMLLKVLLRALRERTEARDQAEAERGEEEQKRHRMAS